MVLKNLFYYLLDLGGSIRWILVGYLFFDMIVDVYFCFFWWNEIFGVL